VPLEPHHVLGVEPPRLLLQGFGGQVLRFGALQIVEDEEERFGRQPMEKLERVGSERHRLRVIRRRHVRRARQVGAQPFRVGRVRHVVERRFQ